MSLIIRYVTSTVIKAARHIICTIQSLGIIDDIDHYNHEFMHSSECFGIIPERLSHHAGTDDIRRIDPL